MATILNQYSLKLKTICLKCMLSKVHLRMPNYQCIGNGTYNTINDLDIMGKTIRIT